MFDELKEVKYFKETKSLKSVKIKAEPYLEPTVTSIMEHSVKIANSEVVTYLRKKFHHQCSTEF